MCTSSVAVASGCDTVLVVKVSGLCTKFQGAKGSHSCVQYTVSRVYIVPPRY